MSLSIIGEKVGMTQVFDKAGNVIPVTVLKAGPCLIVEKKSKDKNGYTAIKIGYGDIAERKLRKPELGFFKKKNLKPCKVIKEVRIDNVDDYKEGDSLLCSIFKSDELVDVIGTTKGRGFAGGIRRHHFHGGDSGHGSMSHRAPGSIGSNTFPARVWPGHRLPGRMGNAQRTMQRLKVIEVDPEQNLLLVKGAVPGCLKSIVIIQKTKKAKI